MSRMLITDDQIIEALHKTGSTQGAWQSLRKIHGRLGKPSGTFNARCRRLKQAAGLQSDPLDIIKAKRGIAPDHDMIRASAPGYFVRGVSTYHKATKETPAQWVKTQIDKEENLEAWMAAMTALLEPIRGKAKPLKGPKRTNDNLLTGYVLGDMHIGLMCWEPEVGDNFDLKIAEQLYCQAIDRLVSVTPSSTEALIINVGDLQHSNDPTNKTPGHGNQLDVDGRDPKIRRATLKVMRYYIDRVLEHHKKVYFLNTPGNHDISATTWIGLVLDALYEKEPRIQIDIEPSYFRYHRFGKNLIGVTHGDTVKLEELAGIMAVDREKDWGETKHRVWLTGHVHHLRTLELRGCTVETFRTLAKADAWHMKSGYRSGRDMRAIVWDRDHGEDTRHTVGVSRLKVVE
jgi:hypothetical protein